MGIGCHVSGCFAGAFVYADDITLLAPSCNGMNIMLEYCEKYAVAHDITFNYYINYYIVFTV